MLHEKNPNCCSLPHNMLMTQYTYTIGTKNVYPKWAEPT